MDPLSFAEEDASGLQPYERFERIEHHYEVLAAKKRPALQESLREVPAKRSRQEEILGASFEEILETMNYGMMKRSRKIKKKGRRKGSKNKVKPEVSRKLGDATLHYAHGQFEKAICLLKEVILLAPNLSDPYHTLGLIYTAMGDKKKALNFYMIAAHLTPKDCSLWKLLVARSIEQGDKRQANYCLNKAIVAEPQDIGLRFHRASLYTELGEYVKAADSYGQISRLCPDDIEVLEKATQLYKKCGQRERAVCMLESRFRNHENVANLSVVDLLVSVLMESNSYARALEYIERTEQACITGKEIPLHISIKAGICHVHLGHLEKAKAYFNGMKPENASSHPHLVIDIADSLMTVGHCESALKYYMMLQDDVEKYNGYLHLKIARCYASVRKGAQAIECYYKAIKKLYNSVDARLALVSLLLEENRDDEAVSVLSPPVESESNNDTNSDARKLWWGNGKIKLKLAQIYKGKGSVEVFADVLFPVIRKTLFLETVQQKVKVKPRLSRSVLSERVKVLDYNQTDNVFHGFRPVASSAELSKASRAKKLLEKKAAKLEAQKAAALAAGIDWKSEDSDDESPQVLQESPLPDFLKEEENHLLIIDLCKSLSSSRRYWDALEIITFCLKLESNTFSVQTKEELQTLGAQVSYNIADPARGWDCVRYIVSRHPYSFSAWSCYYKGILRDNRLSKRNKFLHNMRLKHKDSVPPILISAHRFTMISQHQVAAREYLEAHRLMPDNPLINLCAGTALINLGIGHRLQNKHQAVLQGLAFLYNNVRLCGESQEALFNIARAYHHVGLVSLATTYYEKVLAIREKDYPIPTLPNDKPDLISDKKPGYCDLRREAAYNLHLIYERSGAFDLARNRIEKLGFMVELGDAILAMENNTSNIGLIPGETIVYFDEAEHPQELELESEPNLQEDVEDGEDADNSEVSVEEEETGGLEAVYKFQFPAKMDPLSFAEEDASGLQPYERFERIEHHYEVLAAKKRPALQESLREVPAKRSRQEEILGASFEEILETMNYGMMKRSRKIKKKGRRKGSKNKVKPEVSRKLGDATLHYAHGQFEKAICLLKEVILLAPNLSDPYHTLGLIYTAMGDKKKALNFYMIAAHLTPKDCSLWKLLVARSIEQGDKRQANYCLNKAIVAEPQDIGLRFHRASLYTELGEYVKAADSYGQISRLCPDDIEVLEKATQLYKKCGQRERAVCMLESRFRNHENVANLSVVDLLVSVLMESNSYARALEYIERTEQACITGKEIPLHISIKAGICHVHLGHLEKAKAYFNGMKPENASSHPHLVIDIADSLMTVGHCESALKYYMMLQDDVEKYNGYLHLKIARCYASVRKGAQAIECYYKAIKKLYNSVDARLALVSLLLEENRDDEAVSVLSPPVESESNNDTNSDARKLWWGNGKIKLKLAQIYKGKGSVEVFADVLFPVIRKTLFLETVQQKVKVKPRLSRSVLSERVKVLDYNQTDNVFHGFRPVASSAELSKASRAKKLLEKKAAKLEAQKAAALAAGIDWKSEDSDDESPQVLQESPLPDFLKEEENHLLIIDLCKSLSSSRRYWDALEIITFCLKLESNTFSVQTKEELQTLGAQVSYNIADPARGWDCVRYIVSRHPYSFSAWSCYYKGILRDNRLSKRNKFLHNMRLKHKDSVPPILISAHRFTMISQHQVAAREYLEAHRLMPDNPLINLCAGTALINLGIGHRLQNKHQAVLQGLAFLYNNVRLCGESQEALFNIARAYHHVGLVSLATTYYEKVLAIREKDYPIPTLPNDKPDLISDKKPGYCDLRREAAYNLHLIYERSGAFDLARQVLKDHVVM